MDQANKKNLKELLREVLKREPIERLLNLLFWIIEYDTIVSWEDMQVATNLDDLLKMFTEQGRELTFEERSKLLLENTEYMPEVVFSILMSMPIFEAEDKVKSLQLIDAHITGG